LGERVGEMQSTARFLCAYISGLQLPEVPPSAAGGPSPGAAAARARLQHFAERGDDAQRVVEILHLLDEERSPWGRSTLAATASCLLQASNTQRAEDMARRAIAFEPKNSTGEFCAPWVQFATITRGTSSAASAVRAMQAWAPWDSYGWLFDALEQRDPEIALEYAQRAYTLSPLDTYIAVVFVDKLLARGGHQRARGVLASLMSGHDPVHRLASELLKVRVDASEAQFRQAFDRARAAMQIAPTDAGWARVQRFSIAWDALGLAEVLGDATTATAD